MQVAVNLHIEKPYPQLHNLIPMLQKHHNMVFQTDISSFDHTEQIRVVSLTLTRSPAEVVDALQAQANVRVHVSIAYV